MKYLLAIALFSLMVLAQASEKKPVKTLQIGIKKKVENCPIKSRKGDSLSM
jgi:FK506-binding protein 2